MEMTSSHTMDSLDLNEKRVLVRVDFNVPLNKAFEVTDDTRICAVLPTIKAILNQGGSIILMSHLGRPKGKRKDEFSLVHILPQLKKHLPDIPIIFSQDCVGEETQRQAKELQKGSILLLENLRFHPEEENGDPQFAKKLASLGEIYINDAFGTAHRAHASTAVIANYLPKHKKAFGLLMQKEIANAKQVMENPKKPFCAILGGAKVSDKILVIKKLLPIADHVIIGGGMAYTFLKAQGNEIGLSIVEDDRLDTTREIMHEAKEHRCQIHLPSDFIIADKFDNEATIKETETTQISAEWMGLDIGTKTRKHFHHIILSSKTILWNGPVGVFEMPSFQKGTISVAQSVAQTTLEEGAFSLIGGGDSVAAINQFGFADKVSYISTGGGALLEFFEGKLLPGIVAMD